MEKLSNPPAKFTPFLKHNTTKSVTKVRDAFYDTCYVTKISTCAISPCNMKSFCHSSIADSVRC